MMATKTERPSPEEMRAEAVARDIPLVYCEYIYLDAFEMTPEQLTAYLTEKFGHLQNIRVKNNYSGLYLLHDLPKTAGQLWTEILAARKKEARRKTREQRNRDRELQMLARLKQKYEEEAASK